VHAVIARLQLILHRSTSSAPWALRRAQSVVYLVPIPQRPVLLREIGQRSVRSDPPQRPPGVQRATCIGARPQTSGSSGISSTGAAPADLLAATTSVPHQLITFSGGISLVKMRYTTSQTPLTRSGILRLRKLDRGCRLRRLALGRVQSRFPIFRLSYQERSEAISPCVSGHPSVCVSANDRACQIPCLWREGERSDGVGSSTIGPRVSPTLLLASNAPSQTGVRARSAADRSRRIRSIAFRRSATMIPSPGLAGIPVP